MWNYCDSIRRCSPLVFFLFLVVFATCFGAQISSAFAEPAAVYNGETGIPFIRNFTASEYDFHPQNWGIVQDARGVMFIANTAGMLEYDGVTWRQHRFFENLTIASVDIDDKGTLYVGGRGDFGYLVADSSGQLQFVSLAAHLPEKYRNFKLVWETVAASHGVYFRTSRYIFRWDGKEIKTWEVACHYLTIVRDTLYAAVKGVGLQWLNKDTLQLLPGGERFANTTMYVILPYGEQAGLLLGTSTEGIYRYDGHAILPFRTEADDFFRTNKIYHGVRIPGPDPLWALATTRGGLVVIDERGRVRQMLNKSLGLPDDKIHFVFRDRQGALWLSLNNGLSRIEFPSPFSIFDERLGLQGTPHAITKHHGKLYVVTNRGLFSLTRSADAFLPMFKPIPGISFQGWCLLSTEDALLIGTARGIYMLRENKLSLLTRMDVATYCLYQPGWRKDIVYAGTRDGLGILRFNAGWKFLGKIEGITEAIRTISEDRNGVLWLGTASQGLLRIETKQESLLNPDIQRFGKDDGLPEGMAFTYSIDNQARFGTYKGLYRYDSARRLFRPDSSLGSALADSLVEINQIVQSKSGRIWAMAGMKKSRLQVGDQTEGGGYVWTGTPFQRMTEVNSLMDLVPENNGNVWLVGRDEKIYHYDAAFRSNWAVPYGAWVRKISTILSDSLIWGGAFAPGTTEKVLSTPLPYNQNSLRFEYAAASYDASSANRYQIKLDGYDEDWLQWTYETQKDYTGLPAGEYTFRVRARNVYEYQSDEDAFSFTILSPWHQTWWAYGLYAVFGLGCIALIIKSRVRYLERKTKELEAIVVDRTSVIREQADKLKTMAQIKSRFFANISHEFRTPMTLIIGPLDDMIARARNSSHKKELGLMRRNAKRVLQLINQLLDLSRLESGKIKLRARRGDLEAFLKGIVMSFASLAEQKNITLKFEPARGEGLHQVYFDHDHIEKIFYNLLSNAFKFTPEGGEVCVQLSGIGQAPETIVEIVVKDTGIGIPGDRLPHIFDRFYQVDASSTREQEGTGIGLALTKELVELHHGEIKVQSEAGKGAEFIVRLPVGKTYFVEDEIDDTPVPRTETGLEVLEDVQTDARVEPETEMDEDAPIILVVDDHADVRAYIRRHLEGEFAILEARNGQEGVESALETIPDLVISDVMMSKLDGYQLCAALKTNEKTSHVPVILLTARAGEEDKLAGLETGADDYLTKPFNSKELHVRVNNLIRQRRKLQERFRKEGLLQPREIAAPSVEEAFLQKMMAIIEEHLEDEDFGVETLSGSLHMGRRQLHRKIKALTGAPPSDFIRSVRLQRAKQLLEQKAGNVSEIAFQTGFSSLSYFSKAFKDQFGMLPSEV